MTRSLIAFLLASCNGNLHTNTVDTAVGHDTADSGEVVDTADSGIGDTAIDSGDSAEDTGADTADSGVEETGDTATEDTAVDTGEDTATEVCAFPVKVWDIDRTDGEVYPESSYDMVVMENELLVELNSSTPSGTSTPGYHEVLRVNFTAVHAGCPDVTVTTTQLSSYVTDNAGTGWYEDLFLTDGFDQINLTTGDSIGGPIVQGSGFWDMTDAVAYMSMNEFVIPAGTTYTIAWYADTTGASEVADDMIQMDITPDSMVWDDGVTSVVAYLDRVEGGTISY